ncbi:Starch-binding associating with outer membrane [Mucilaginibacter sp. OK268]|uniref:RagB/SusD family nutrient uptake outer membrane protein n=1 Tax=Mucilaginibacter sp. OK268 TaxID=1881048 RepID=UPI00088D775D|nr:RagB/SusD family nutrient uptake outer membrane protein [Mucilaginibacter sp. OK268]SDP76447.1 Starch-binding associating with outer membrane [Mucilaginibacter sp. OK268]
MKKNIKLRILVICLILITSACSKGYLDKSPLSGPSDQNFFTNQDELILAVNGIYPTLKINFDVNMPIVTSLDEATDIGWNRNVDGLQSLGQGNQDSNNAYTQTIWTQFYTSIGRCNFILDNVAKVKDKTTPAIYTRSIAEARFVRAYAYQNLIELFGGVPLVTNMLSINNAQLPRSSKADVLTFVLNELDAAANDLPVSYGASDAGRATKGAALAIKARAALYNGQWDAAIAAAKAVMDLNTYSLHNNFADLFTYNGQTSKEIILALQYLKSAAITQSTAKSYLSRNGLGYSNKLPSQSLVDAFECTDGLTIDKSPLYNPAKPFANRDPRLGFTIALPGSVFYNYQFETHKDSLQCWNYNTSPATRVPNQEAINAFATATGYCWRKYVDLTDKADPANSELNVILVRYAEVLLIYAEAKIEKGEIDQSVYDAINSIRQRSGVNMPAIQPGQSQAQLRSVVRKERLYEFATEGFRLFDIRRWKIADLVMKGPLYGRIPRGLLASAPSIDANGIANYSNVPNKADMRVVEVRNFNANRDYLWPIPNIETVTDPAIVQNPGY